MKNLIFTIFAFLFSTTSLAQSAPDCASLIRAPHQDQIYILMDVTLEPQALGLTPKEIFSAGIENYVSWKGQQIETCLADVIHRADLKIRVIREDQLCTLTLAAHRKDFFTTGVFRSEYKIRDLQENCQAPTKEENQILLNCKASLCGVVNDVKTYPDHTDDCRCKPYEDILRIQDQTGKYDGFFDLDSDFKKPEGLESPFTDAN